jgi:2-desacetyl-2-hydroxyethyl bacteriochlorophyllide A dehydrogenase
MEHHTAIPEKMPAVVCHGTEDYRLEEVRAPKAGPGEVVVNVLASGICASDVKCFHGAPLFWGDDDRPVFVDGPCVPGHEFIGEVVDLGPGAEERHGVSIGDWAIAEQIVPCGACRYCERGQYWVCENTLIFGFQKAVNGAMAPYMKFPEQAIVHKVPKSLGVRKAAMIEPLSCAIHAVERGEVQLGDVVVIAGCGVLGLLMAGVARLKGPGKLISLDPIASRREMALRMGADLAFDPYSLAADEAIRAATDGYGCDVYIEASGNPDAVPQGLRMIRKLGTFVEFSLLKEPVVVDWTIIGDQKELNIHGSHLGPYSYPCAIDYIDRGLVEVEPLITHAMALDQFDQAWAQAGRKDEALRVILEP